MRLSRPRRQLLALAALCMSGLASAADKFVALTFDDGPDTVQTARVLDRLKAHGAKATFFVLGERLTPAHHSVVERIKAEGHEIGVHGFDHKALDKLSEPEAKAETAKAYAAVAAGTGTKPAWYRATFLSVSPTLMASIDLSFAGGIAAFDWPGTDAVTAQQRAQKVLQSPDLRNGAIILLHDVQPEPHPSAELLDILIPALKEQGYGFPTLSELFKQRGVQPALRKQWLVAE